MKRPYLLRSKKHPSPASLECGHFLLEAPEGGSRRLFQALQVKFQFVQEYGDGNAELQS
jgi:hypothetical protein